MKNILVPAFLVTAVPAFAADMADVDGDGAVTQAEFSAAYPDLGEAKFAELDLDGDGALNAEELAKGMEMGVLPKASN